MRLFNRGSRLNQQQFSEQLRLFGHGPDSEPVPGTPPERLLGPAHGTTAGGRQYWMVGEPQPGAHPGQGKLFTNEDLPSRGRYA